VKLWSVAERREIATLKGHSRRVSSIAFSPDGTLLASGSYDDTVKLWSVKERREIATLKGFSVAFSPDGALLASGSNDGTVLLWDMSPYIPKNGKVAWDVNGDGVVDIFDLVLVGRHFGESGAGITGDVNRDGIVNIFDLVTVGAHFGEVTVAAAPSIQTSPTPLKHFSPKEIATIQRVLAELEAMNHPPPGAKIAIEFLRAWLVDTGYVATETKLLPNYPNPFNPETWIPYQLSEASEVTITIYDTAGRLVRRIPLGYKAAGVYYSKTKAAYWDGRNSAGEPVGSGVYFYHLQTAHFSAARKLVVVK